MRTASLLRTIAQIAAVLFVFALFASGSPLAEAAEIKVLTSVALTPTFDELAPQFEKASGNKLAIGYALIAEVRKRMLAGESADVVILSRPVMEELEKAGKLASDGIVDVAGTEVGIAARAGAQKPDIGTVEALKRTLLAAKSISYADPAKGGASGVYFAQVLERLGIAAEMKPKTVLVPGPQAGEAVAKGEAELGVAQVSELVTVPGTELVGTLPGEYARVTMFSAALGAGSKVAEEAKAFIRFLTEPTAAAVFKAKGFKSG